MIARRLRPPRRGSAIGYAFIGPFFVNFLLFQAFALVAALLLSFTDWHGALGGAFIGLDNYARLFSDVSFQRALLHTVLVWIVAVPLLSFGGLALAWLLNAAVVRGRGILRTMLFLPILPALVVVGIVFLLLLDPRYGLPNLLLHAAGLVSVNVKTDPAAAVPVLIVVVSWRWLGYNVVIHLAGLRTLSREVLEAASMDGASAWQSFRHVVLPMSRPMLVFTAVLSTIGVVNLFDEPYVLFGGGGGPDGGGLMLGPYIFRQGFQYFNMGYASAIAYAVAAMVFLFSMLQVRLNRDVV